MLAPPLKLLGGAWPPLAPPVPTPMKLFYETVKSKVIISLFETVRLSVLISSTNFYNSLKSIKENLEFKLKRTDCKVIEKLMEHDIHCLPCSYTNDVIDLSS